MVKIMSAPVIIAFCLVGIFIVIVNERIDPFDPIMIFLLGVLFEELRRMERYNETKSGDERL